MLAACFCRGDNILSALFYRALEEKFRGTREEIKSRLLIYLPFLQPLIKVYTSGQVLDIGCGRGEWLELLNEQGFDAKGVDLDGGMLEACRELGLQVEQIDALTYMRAQPASSFCVVSLFHVAEHLPFNILQQIVQEAKRILLPGGLLIIESPNPENIYVSTNRFYLDPTHQNPIPPELMAFLPEYYNYHRIKILRLQESVHLKDSHNLCLKDVLNGVSPDYAIVAQTQGQLIHIEAFDTSFQQNYGITFDALSERYQASLDQRLTDMEIKAQQAEDKANQAFYESQRLHFELLHIYTSKFWRITAPLRWLFEKLKF
jgi:SAM-dependent methyltransferase